MTTLYPGDRVRTVIEWGCFRHKRGKLLEMRGDRPFVLLDDYVLGILLYANEVVLDEPSSQNLTGAE